MMDTMNIALPTGLKEFVQTRVADGGYSSVSEYVRELIRADQKEAAQACLEAAVLTGLKSGESTPMVAVDWERLRDELQQRHAKRR